MLREKLGKELLFFDGGTGTILQEKGLKAGELPEVWNIEQRETIVQLHTDYLNAGCNHCTPQAKHLSNAFLHPPALMVLKIYMQNYNYYSVSGYVHLHK